MRCRAWEVPNASVGPENFIKAIVMDIIPFAFPYDTKPTDLLSKVDYKFVMEAWGEVLGVLLEHNQVRIALCSKSTLTTFAQRLFGSVAQMNTFHRKHPLKFISASLYYSSSSPSRILV